MNTEALHTVLLGDFLAAMGSHVSVAGSRLDVSQWSVGTQQGTGAENPGEPPEAAGVHRPTPESEDWDPWGYATERLSMLEEYCRLPGEGDVVVWQRKLADAIIAAEGASNDPDVNLRRAAKRHRHLLRVIGDALVQALIPQHTIRALSRHAGRPAHLSSQGADFDSVFETARELQARGAVPILCDLTTLLGIGDLVCWGGGGIAVLECKNRAAPTRELSGRLARQEERGLAAETYLKESWVQEDGGERVAVPRSLPEPDYDAVERLVHACLAADDGVAAHQFDVQDILIASRLNGSFEAITAILERFASHSDDGNPPNGPAVAFLKELVDSATYRRVSPSSYPLPADQRWQLLEGHVQLIRLVNTDRLACSIDDDGVTLQLVPRHGEYGIEVEVADSGAEPIMFTHEVVEYCIWAPISVEALRDSLAALARQELAQRRALRADETAEIERAEGDEVVYATVYRRTAEQERKWADG